MKLGTSQHSRWTWLQMTQGPYMKAQNSRDLNKRCWSLHDKELYLNHGEDDMKGPHTEGRKSTIDREASGSETGPNQAETCMGRSAQTGRPRPAAWAISGPVRDALWPKCFSINCLRLRQPPHPSIHQRVAKMKEKHREADDGHHESSNFPRRWPRPTLSAMVALHGWAMEEFQS
jgi:hypothetical protein